MSRRPYMTDIFKKDISDSLETTTFREYGLHPYLLEGLENSFSYCSSIQKKVLDNKIQDGANAMILSETGSGKTLSYLIPTLNRIYHTKDRLEKEKVSIGGANYKNPSASNSIKRNSLSLKPSVSRTSRGGLIMTSSQHLLSQIELQLSDLDFKKTLNVSIENKSNALPTNFMAYDLILCTPSKLFSEKTLLNHTALGLNPEVIVFDEFDTCFALSGFKYQTVKVLDLLLSQNRAQKQFLFTAATLPRRIFKHSAKDFFRSKVSNLQVVESNNMHKLNQNIDFEWIRTDLENDPKILPIVQKELKNDEKILIFCNTKQKMEQLQKFFTDQGLGEVTGTFSGELSTQERVSQLNSLYLSKIKILICTEVAARGIDSNEVKHVILYDFPTNVTSFIHKVGRTGRMGTSGKVTSFIRDYNIRLLDEIYPLLEKQDKMDSIMSSRGSLGRRIRRQESRSSD
ncbi:unnamed protein product [Moneuplotes crassus]|uniref:Uncharacterized protein n=1 Tax=Euplotes crassus TaxID=5936 RepID=A0AAD2D6W6_EUPCR|nr:unnamed protein product [Moneuplotes crassus]